MSVSETYSETRTFTITDAIHMAAKVAADLKRLQRLYIGGPSDDRIAEFEKEITLYLKAGYLDTVTYGYRRDDKWIEPTLKYTAKELAINNATDDDPGRVRANANIDGASFYSYMTRNASWYKLSSAQREAFEKTLPFKRGGAPEPTVSGYLTYDRTYSSGGKALDRASVRSF